jgi:transcriptional regulator with XRE-family HTH domain
MAYKLNNYLRTYRKRAGLSQDEMAYLLGCRSGAKVSRYERFARQPTLQTALAYEAIFAVPVRDLFAGIYQKVERPVSQRAQLLLRKLTTTKPDRPTMHKLQRLKAVVSLPTIESGDHS